LRIVIASQRVDQYPARDERRDALDQAWASFLAYMGFVLVPIPNRVDDAAELADVLNATALILTGGNSIPGIPNSAAAVPERDSTERRLLEWSMREGRPVLAVCRGFQFVNMCLGGRLGNIHGHVGTMHEIQWHGNVHEGFRALRRVNSFHEAGIAPADLASELLPMACAPDGSVEAARHRDFPILGLMWHPERPPECPPQTVELLRQHLTGMSH